jgi:hypothetical protein
MPSNRFPDSTEKRALRRRDAQLLEQFAKRIDKKLEYCGMPSVEFLDVESWRASLKSVVGIEYDHDVADDMRIERNQRQFPFPVDIIESDICSFLSNCSQVFDVYNLDFYTGFVNISNAGAKSIKAIRSLFHKQSQAQRSFSLISTFNVRDKGANEYLKFLKKAGQELSGHPHGEENILEHSNSQASRLKICFPYFCWQLAHANCFEHEMAPVYMYQTSATMVHFHQAFTFIKGDTLTVPALQALIDIANMTLFQMKNEIPYKYFIPTPITN